MNNMKRLLPLLLAVCMILCACAQDAPAETTAAPTETTVETTAAPTETTVETTQAPTETTAQTTAPTEAELLFRHPLNGTPLAEAFTGRPYLAVINNISFAMPQCSVSSADMIFEVLAEGGVTRCLALYSDLTGVDHIGSIRSARPYLVDIANSFDAIFIHHGGSTDGYDEIHNTAVEDLDGMASGAFYRDQSRLDDGYDLEHTSFADGDDLIADAKARGYDLEVEEGLDYGFAFAEEATPADGENATDIRVEFGPGGKPTTLTYNEKTGTYDAYQHGDDFIDGNTGKVMSFRNVISIAAETYVYDGTRLVVTLVGEGDGYFACGGKIIPICWSRVDRYDPFVFTMADGTPLTLGVGTTYVGITPLAGQVIYE